MSKWISVCYWLLRHADDHEVQPVPGVSEEGEISNTESSGQNFDGCFKCVDGCKHVSVPRKKNLITKTFKDKKHVTVV